MKYIKTYEHISEQYFHKKFYDFLQTIVRRDLRHDIIFYTDHYFSMIDNFKHIIVEIEGTIIRWYNKYNQLDNYPGLKDYLEYKIPHHNNDYLMIIEFDEIPDNFDFYDDDEYKIYKDIQKYNL